MKRRGASLPVEHGRARRAEKSRRGSTALALQWAGTAEEIIAICDSTNGRRFLRHPHLGLIFFPDAPACAANAAHAVSVMQQELVCGVSKPLQQEHACMVGAYS